MRLTGIIAEYNPLHNGHVYHMAEARKRTGADAIVVVLSGPFTQRGDPAAFDSVTRARWAASCGADLVLELPAAYATGGAQLFALGGINLLKQIGADAFSFGCEADDPSLLEQIARMLAEEPPAFSSALREALNSGVSYPRARASALGKVMGTEAENAAGLPNNILALEYLQASFRLGGPEPVPVRRIGGGYRELSLSRYPSAAAIREALFRGEKAEGLPDTVRLEEAVPLHPQSLYPIARLSILNADPDSLAELPDMSEGLHLRLLDAARVSGTYGDFIKAAVTRRYTEPRLRRALLHAVLGMSRQDAVLLRSEFPMFVRPLALGPAGRKVLAEISGRAPLLTEPVRYTPSDAGENRLWTINRQAWKLYSVLANRPSEEDLTIRLMS